MRWLGANWEQHLAHAHAGLTRGECLHEVGDNGLCCLVPLIPLLRPPVLLSRLKGSSAAATQCSMTRASTQMSLPGAEDDMCNSPLLGLLTRPHSSIGPTAL